MTDGRYERLRAAVVEALDAEIGDDVVALRQLLLEALDDECEVEFVEAMERVPTDAQPDGAAIRQQLQVLFDAANEAKYAAANEGDVNMSLWHSGRANAFAQVLAHFGRVERVPGGGTDG